MNLIEEKCLKRWYSYLDSFKKKYINVLRKIDVETFSNLEKKAGIVGKTVGIIGSDIIFREEKTEFRFQSDWAIASLDSSSDFQVARDDYESSSYSLTNTVTGEVLFQYISRTDHLSTGNNLHVELMLFEEQLLNSSEGIANCDKLESSLRLLQTQYGPYGK